MSSDIERTKHKLVTYEQEQAALKDAFQASTDIDDDEDLLKPKPKDSESEVKKFQAFLASTLQDETSRKFLSEIESLASKPAMSLETEEQDNDAFFAKYMLSRAWTGRSATQPELHEDDSSEEENAENFENQYNFRFEQPGGTQLTTHARTVDTVRRGDDKRKRERDRKRGVKEELKRKEMEEIARLRNLKRIELEDRIRKLEGVAGAGGWTERDLEADFDDEEWDRRMRGVFNEDYYNSVVRFQMRWKLTVGRQTKTEV